METPQRKRNRREGHDYRQGGWYFVTLCCQDRTEWFGRVIDGTVLLSDVGALVDERWRWLGRQYTYVELGPYVVMPDHVHGLIALRGADVRDGDGPVATGPYEGKSLSGLIGAFKTTSSKAIHGSGRAPFRWQKSFHDRIVRDEQSLARIRQYIEDNPRRWGTESGNLDGGQS